MNRIEIPIVFSTDHNFVMQTGVCILSLLMNAVDEYYNIHILIAKDVTDGDKQKLRQTIEPYPAKLNFVCMDATFDKAYEIRNISTASYYRLLIPWLLPQYDKVIYADVDMIFQIGLHEVYNMDIGDNYVAAVRAIGATVDSNMRNYVKSLNLNIEEYINAGFLVINSRKQREDNLKSVYLSHAARKYVYQDQDIINILCKDKIYPLPMRYNVNDYLYDLFANKKGNYFISYNRNEIMSALYKGVLHYKGMNKPWKAFCYRFDIWWHYYRCSLFYSVDNDMTTFNRILNPTYTLRDVLKIVYYYIMEFVRQ